MKNFFKSLFGVFRHERPALVSGADQSRVDVSDIEFVERVAIGIAREDAASRSQFLYRQQRIGRANRCRIEPIISNMEDDAPVSKLPTLPAECEAPDICGKSGNCRRWMRSLEGCDAAAMNRSVAGGFPVPMPEGWTE